MLSITQEMRPLTRLVGDFKKGGLELVRGWVIRLGVLPLTPEGEPELVMVWVIRLEVLPLTPKGEPELVMAWVIRLEV